MTHRVRARGWSWGGLGDSGWPMPISQAIVLCRYGSVEVEKLGLLAVDNPPPGPGHGDAQDETEKNGVKESTTVVGQGKETDYQPFTFSDGLLPDAAEPVVDTAM